MKNIRYSSFGDVKAKKSLQCLVSARVASDLRVGIFNFLFNFSTPVNMRTWIRYNYAYMCMYTRIGYMYVVRIQ